MKRGLKILFFVFMLAGFPVMVVSRETTKTVIKHPVTGKPVEVVDGEIIVKYRKGVSKAKKNAFNAKHGTSMINELEKLDIQVVKVPPGRKLEEMLRLLSKSPEVEIAEPNFIRKAFKVEPDDTYFNNQWGLLTDKLQCPEAWDITQGTSSIIIAVIDSGINYNHDDLKDNYYYNPGETGGDWDTDGLDNDGNGYIDDCKGWDFADDDNDPMDVYGHGTQVAGAAAAKGNNGTGVAGVAWNCKIMNIRLLDAEGFAESAFMISALEYAADNGAAIINMSFGGDGSSVSEQAAINYAAGKGCIIIAAAGNDNLASLSYPAAYENVVSVGATNRYDIRCDPDDWGNTCGKDHKSPCGSNYGEGLDVVAPGSGILTTSYSSNNPANNSYAYASGTSLATPLVSGLIALVKTHYTALDNEAIIDRIIFSCDDVGDPGYDLETGYGRVNAKTALEAQYIPTSTRNLATLNYPNPFKPSADSVNTIVLSTYDSPVSLNIYTLAGELVKSVDGSELTLSEIRKETQDSTERQLVFKYEWDGKNDREKDLSTGVYIYIFATTGGEVKGKIALVR